MFSMLLDALTRLDQISAYARAALSNGLSRDDADMVTIANLNGAR